MKFKLNFALWVATANALRFGPQLPSDIPFGNLIAAISASFNNLTKILLEATNDFRSGAPLPVIFDHAVPKVLTGVKLHRRTVMHPEKRIRAGSITAKSAFGPYVLVGKNVNAPTKIASLL